ncbi:outer membrane protein assembly factor BamE [Caulobacter sp. 17J65-9]|uniref:outer membrane protein assembly factor BamE n=1 Tax=Caulobacter sp. 17J65-9 TaxID=2709382 RepID=UPI0013C55FFF|nr:outer membrane protein assembly factor BamE [Caulobacter sp. 17J65-9]NEX92083.1 outer membrane protein assembly factor BamE [Caulobacter sp. 17J65-9]
MSNFRTALIVAATVAGLSACAPTVARQGYQAVDANPKEVKVGEDTKSTVLSKLGSPSAISTFEPNTWYYVSQITSTTTYHRPQVNSRDVTVVSFDPASEQVTAVKALDMADGRKIAFNDRETPTRGRELTVLEQLLGNVGRTVMPNTEENQPGGRRPD